MALLQLFLAGPFDLGALSGHHHSLLESRRSGALACTLLSAPGPHVERRLL